MKQYIPPTQDEIGEDSGQPRETPEYERTTLADWGAQMPIGVMQGNPGALARDFAFREFRFQEEREIEKLRNAKGGSGTHPGKTVVTVLAHMLTKWGGESFESKSQKLREAAILKGNMEDVLYAWIYFRTTEVDPIISLDIECPVRACGHKHTWMGDLRTIELSVSRGEIEPQRFDLTVPIDWSGQEYDQILCLPTKWHAVSGIKAGGTMADVKSQLALSSVQSLAKSSDASTPPVPVSDRMLDFFGKRDIERLTKFIAEAFPSIDSAFEIRCPKCGNVHETSLDWTWDFFFGGSSISAAKTS